MAPCREPGCTHEFDFIEEIIKANLARGIADPEILSDLLGDPKMGRTLEETAPFIVQKEQGKVTRNAVGECTGVTCNDRRARSRSCEAWTFTCAKCAVKCHYTTSCSKCIRICSQAGTRTNSPKDRGPFGATKAQDNNAGCVFDQFNALHQDIIDHLIVPVPRIPLLWPPSTGTAPGRLYG